MKRCALLFLILVFALHVPAQSGSEASPLAFKKIQALAGDWEGKDASGMPAKTNFKVVVADTTVMETLQMHGEPEMLTLYTVDGAGLPSCTSAQLTTSPACVPCRKMAK